MIAGIVEADDGRIHLDGKDITRQPILSVIYSSGTAIVGASTPSSGPVRHWHLALFFDEPADVGIQKDDEHRLRRSQTKRSQPRGCRPLLDLDGHGCPGAFWGAAVGGRP